MGPRAAFAVALLLTTAGCSVVPVGNDPSSSTRTLTPAPVPEPGTAKEGVPPADALPPGVFPNGTVDRSRLAVAHVDALAGRSYTWVYRETQVPNRAELWVRQSVRRVEVGESAVLVRKVQRSPYDRTESRYLTSGRRYVRLRAGNSTQYRVSANGTETVRLYLFSIEVLLARFVPDRPVELQLVERNGRRYVRLYAPPGDPPPELTFDPDAAWNYTATVYVTPAGLVRRGTATFTLGEDLDRSYRTTAGFAYTAVGDTTVSRPDWVSRAGTRPTGTTAHDTKPNATRSPQPTPATDGP